MLDPPLIALESAAVEWFVDSAIDAVAGDDQIGFGESQHSVEALGQIGARELAARVPLFAESGYGFAGEARANDVMFRAGRLRRQPGVDACHINTCRSNTVSQKHDSFRFLEQVVRRQLDARMFQRKRHDW